MHTQAEGKLKATFMDGMEAAADAGGRAPPARVAQIQPRPIRYHMWLSQLSYGMTWPARTA
jgi:hypothetical protein